MKPFIALFATFIAGVCSSLGAPFGFNNGDLILGFQATGGTGLTKNVFFNLGSGVNLRNNPNLGSLGNIGTTLSSVFGANWYTRSDVYFGVVANLNGGPPTGVGATGAVNGDPSRTFYVATSADSPGEGTLYAAASYPGASLASASTFLSGMESMIITLTAESNSSAVLDQTAQSVEWQNGWTARNPVPGAAFGVFTGGIQQNFGKATSSTYVDIQRVLSTNTGASPAGVVGGGTYVSTIAISSTGNITASKSPYDNWMATFPSITDSDDKLPTADPDDDGVPNQEEFGFGGDPSNPSDKGMRLVNTVDTNGDLLGDFTLTLEVRSGASFSANGNDVVATIDGVTYRIEGSMDLVEWDKNVNTLGTALGSGSPSSGYVFKTFRLVGANGLSDLGFIRASVTK